MSKLVDRHSAATAHAMQRASMFDLFSDDLVDVARVPVKQTLVESVQLLWPGWTPFMVYDADDERDGELFVFTHPCRGWGVSFVMDGNNKWDNDPKLTMDHALDHSASGPSLTVVCERLLDSATAVTSLSALAVIDLLLAPRMQPVLAEQQTVFMLALTGRLAKAQEVADWWGIGDVTGHRGTPDTARP